MSKLSRHYRTDDTNGIDPLIKDYLDKEYWQTLANVDRTNPKLLVVFSGGNAMGKSTLSKRISDELGGLVLENDAVKRFILSLRPDIDMDELNKLTWKYTMNLYIRLDSLTSNGLVVRDGLIDWYFDRVLPIFKTAGYHFFIVGFDISKEKAIELIKKRGDTPTTNQERLIEVIDDHPTHINRFRKAYKPDVILDDDNIFDHEFVITKLKETIDKLEVIK